LDKATDELVFAARITETKDMDPEKREMFNRIFTYFKMGEAYCPVCHKLNKCLRIIATPRCNSYGATVNISILGFPNERSFEVGRFRRRLTFNFDQMGLPFEVRSTHTYALQEFKVDGRKVYAQ
jgi:hypothetical protein